MVQGVPRPCAHYWYKDFFSRETCLLSDYKIMYKGLCLLGCQILSNVFYVLAMVHWQGLGCEHSPCAPRFKDLWAATSRFIGPAFTKMNL